MTSASDRKPADERRLHPPKVIFVWTLAAILAFCGFIALGNWQLRRRSWKLHLIAEVATRVNSPAVAAPGPAHWSAIGSGSEQYRQVRVTGRYLNSDETLVHGTSRLGYGYWVMTPFLTTRGFVVLINRGYISASLPFTRKFQTMWRPTGTVTVTGILRLTQPNGGFFRPNRPAKQLWYSRDVSAIAGSLNLPTKEIAPYFVDGDATPGRTGWPVGGLTVIHFANNHLFFAITWYLLALSMLVGGGAVARYEWRYRRPIVVHGHKLI